MALSTFGCSESVSIVDGAYFEKIEDLTIVTLYAVRAEVIGPAKRAAEAPTTPGEDDMPEVLVHLTSRIRIEEILFQDPNVDRKVETAEVVAVGMTLLEDANDAAVANYDELDEQFPGKEDTLVEGDTVLLFMNEAANTPGVDFQLMGYGLIVGNMTTIKAVPGPLNGRSYLTSDLLAIVEKELSTPGQGDEPDGGDPQGTPTTPP